MTVFDRLRQLEANATPGPWEYHPGIPDLAERQVTGSVWLRTSTGFPRIVGYKPTMADAEFIVAARNLWGPLVAVAEAAETVKNNLAFLGGEPGQDFGGHWIPFVDALAALERAVKEQP